MTDRQTIRCPRCRQEALWQDNPFRPFCSQKCQLIDLGRWAQEEYKVPGQKLMDHDNLLEFPNERD
ncbi:MAG: DNA gyrase inhibitor YacG [Desulfuromonadales bacterium]|nr:DNA gyrase inhibitor YacG [Desulfuromonadales bacterium]MDW7756880.1 DNA gyrase inhibitor YacG [Desulfuromonadales bacterium]